MVYIASITGKAAASIAKVTGYAGVAYPAMFGKAYFPTTISDSGSGTYGDEALALWYDGNDYDNHGTASSPTLVHTGVSIVDGQYQMVSTNEHYFSVEDDLFATTQNGWIVSVWINGYAAETGLRIANHENTNMMYANKDMAGGYTCFGICAGHSTSVVASGEGLVHMALARTNTMCKFYVNGTAHTLSGAEGSAESFGSWLVIYPGASSGHNHLFWDLRFYVGIDGISTSTIDSKIVDIYNGDTITW